MVCSCRRIHGTPNKEVEENPSLKLLPDIFCVIAETIMEEIL